MTELCSPKIPQADLLGSPPLELFSPKPWGLNPVPLTC
jgi:hypothetical protein